MQTIFATGLAALSLAVFLSLAIFVQGISGPIIVFHLHHRASGCIAFAGGHYIAAWRADPADGECRIFGFNVAA